MSKKRVGHDPLDDLIPSTESPRKKKGAPTKPSKIEKQRLTVHISVDLIDRLKNAVYWSPGVTLAAIAEEYLSKGVDALEKKNGKPFPPRKEELKGGRPIN